MPAHPTRTAYRQAASIAPRVRDSWRPRVLPALAALLVVVLASCAASRDESSRPAWVDGRFSEAELSTDLLGVGSARGRGPEAAETARQRALAAVLQQLSAQVSTETTSRDTETLQQTRHDGTDRESGVSRTDRQRTITVTSAAQLRGTDFELASGLQDGAEVTWALARIDRDELVHELAGEVRGHLDIARQQLRTAASGLAAAASSDRQEVPQGAVAAMAADSALQSARERLPLVAAAAGRPTAVQRELAAELAVLFDQASARFAELTARLDIDLAGPPPRLRLSGQLDALVLRARWDGAPLSGLPVAARLGDGGVALALTDADGLATLQLPQVSGMPGMLRAGIALDGELGPLLTTLPVAVPAAATARVAVVTRHQRNDGPGAPATPRLQPSAIQGPLEAALGSLHFLVLPLQEDALAGGADYMLVVTTTSDFRSREGRQQQGVLWYGTALQARFVDVTSGEAFSVAVRDTDSRDAGINAEQAEARSLARALARLLDEQRPDSLPSLLRARFR